MVTLPRKHVDSGRFQFGAHAGAGNEGGSGSGSVLEMATLVARPREGTGTKILRRSPPTIEQSGAFATRVDLPVETLACVRLCVRLVAVPPVAARRVYSALAERTTLYLELRLGPRAFGGRKHSSEF